MHAQQHLGARRILKYPPPSHDHYQQCPGHQRCQSKEHQSSCDTPAHQVCHALVVVGQVKNDRSEIDRSVAASEKIM